MAALMLKDKVVVITGGLGLLGRDFAKAVSQEGGIPVIADAAVSKRDRQFPAFKIDIRSEKWVSDLTGWVHKKYGRIDALVNSAYPRNKAYGRKFLDVRYADFCDNLNQHLGGYFLCSQAFVKYFLKQGHGNIVNMASIYGVSAPRFGLYDGTEMTMPVEYAAIKAGVIHLTRYIAAFCKGKNIRSNCISPGGIFNKQPAKFVRRYNAMGLSKGLLDPSDVSGALVFLLSDRSKFVNGQNLVVDDGWTL